MLDEVATQVEFAALVGISQPAIAAHVKAGNLPENGTYRQWLKAYCDRLRTEAAGRTPSNARDRRDMAVARQAEARAALDERELYKQDGLILDLESVRHAMTGWAALGKNELLTAVDNIITAIESEHGITVDREQLQQYIDAALRAIGGYEFEPGDLDQGCPEDMDTAA